MLKRNITLRIPAGIVIIIILVACKPAATGPAEIEAAKQEILDAEAAFNQMAEDVGLAEAFLEFAADSAVLSRNGKIIAGKTAMKEYFETWTFLDVTLNWKPEFVDVSSSLDMGYTYGSYELLAVDTTREVISSQGVFHTVWRKMEDGSWKFVYD